MPRRVFYTDGTPSPETVDDDPMKPHEEIMREWDAARSAIATGDTSSRPRDWLEDVLGEKDARIAELEAALDEIRIAAFEMSRASNGTVQTMCVPIGAWQNAMRAIGVPNDQ